MIEPGWAITRGRWGPLFRCWYHNPLSTTSRCSTHYTMTNSTAAFAIWKKKGHRFNSPAKLSKPVESLITEATLSQVTQADGQWETLGAAGMGLNLSMEIIELWLPLARNHTRPPSCFTSNTTSNNLEYLTILIDI